MPKSLIVELVAPSGSRPSSMLSFLNRLLNPHRMSALTVSEILPPKEQAQQLIHVLTDLENELRDKGLPAEHLSYIACDFDLCQRIMERLPR